jgi:Secretion system C-terminal sorting domain
MKKSVYVSVIIFLLVQCCLSQVKQEWEQRYEGPVNGYDIVAGMVTDNLGNVIVSGFIESNTLTDFATVKYNPDGVLQWSSIFDGGIEDRVIDIGKDNSGNVYVTGLSENNTGTYDIITIKYNSFGDSVWVKRYNSAYIFSMDQPTAIFVRDENNIYVQGYTFGGGFNGYVTIKYDSNGDSVWVARSVEGAGGPSGDIYADNQGSVYINGTQSSSFVIKYSPDGTREWLKNYPMEFMDKKKSIAEDNSGNLFLMGRKSTTTSGDFGIIKINPDGDTLWMRTYNCLGGTTSGNDEANAMSVDNSGNVFITGESFFAATYYSSTVKFSNDGNFLWGKLYSNISGSDGGVDLCNDDSGNLYVIEGRNNFTTIKYNSAGDSLWSEIYTAPASLGEKPVCIDADNSGNVYVSGNSRSSNGSLNYDFVTIKYSQTITGIISDNENPASFELQQNFPNPFNPGTVIRYVLPVSGFVSLKIYNVLGNHIQTLINEKENAGNHSVKFSGAGLPSGIYFYTIQTENFRATRKMVLTK